VVGTPLVDALGRALVARRTAKFHKHAGDAVAGSKEGPMARLRRVPWRVPAGLLLAVAVLALGWLWFRDSPFATVEEVYVTGTSSSEENQVREALRQAAQGMSTLHVRQDALRKAVAPYSSVAGLDVHADFPHQLTIEVLERRPVATVESGGVSVPATGGGRLLDGVRASGLPVVQAAAAATSAGDHVTDRRALAALRVAAAAPEELLARSERIYSGPRGMTLDLRNGPELYFGSADRARMKWTAAARVLAEPSAQGAVYLDLRVPGRVAAGGVGPITPDPTPPILNAQP
jgi:cell division protein FtsQ